MSDRRRIIFLSVILAFCLLDSLPLSAQIPQSPMITPDSMTIREVFIPMPDGVKLAADLYLPAGFQSDRPYPIILEYLPYRKDESRGRRYPFYSYFVQRGYVFARVDIRGTGRSQGRLVDGEYSDQEQSDGDVIIDWLAHRPFSNGNIGMLGISWGGFNGLHMAMRHPPALKTIISLMSTDDIYQDDVHFMDGIMHLDAYEMGMDVGNMVPGPPDFSIDNKWFEDRFDTEPWLLKYKRQQTDGPFWNRASLNEDYSRIDIPVFILGGWYDGYRDFIPRFLEHADVPVKAILGPWNHTWPHTAEPEPAVEWRDIAVRWFDHWLLGDENGILDEPAFIYFQRDHHPPGFDLSEIPGAWYEDIHWPQSRDTVLYLAADHALSEKTAKPFTHHLQYKPTVGMEASGSVMWWGDWAPDQRPADAYSLVYDSPVLDEPMAIIGFPQITLWVRADAPQANWIVRLSDVAPDGSVTEVTGAALNGTHRYSDVNPLPLDPDSLYRLDIELHVTSWIFQPDHHIRVSINNSQWPMFWPTPFAMQTHLYGGPGHSSQISLPVAPAHPVRLRHPFDQPVADPQLPGFHTIASETLSGFAEINTVTRDERTQTTTVLATNSGSDAYPFGTISYTESITHQVSDLTPAKAMVESTYTITVDAAGHQRTYTGLLLFTSDRDNYYYNYTRRLEERGQVLKEKQWLETIPRK